jgi:hypothetical protein
LTLTTLAYRATLVAKSGSARGIVLVARHGFLVTVVRLGHSSLLPDPELSKTWTTDRNARPDADSESPLSLWRETCTRWKRRRMPMPHHRPNTPASARGADPRRRTSAARPNGSPTIKAKPVARKRATSPSRATAKRPTATPKADGNTQVKSQQDMPAESAPPTTMPTPLEATSLRSRRDAVKKQANSPASAIHTKPGDVRATIRAAAGRHFTARQPGRG